MSVSEQLLLGEIKFIAERQREIEKCMAWLDTLHRRGLYADNEYNSMRDAQAAALNELDLVENHILETIRALKILTVNKIFNDFLQS